jgi:hypothetical protein
MMRRGFRLPGQPVPATPPSWPKLPPIGRLPRRRPPPPPGPEVSEEEIAALLAPR